MLRSSFSDKVTIEKVRASWSNIMNMNGAQHVESIQAATALLADSLEELSSGKSVKETDSNGVATDEFEYNDRKLLLYALGGMIKIVTFKQGFEPFSVFVPVQLYENISVLFRFSFRKKNGLESY